MLQHKHVDGATWDAVTVSFEFVFTDERRVKTITEAAGNYFYLEHTAEINCSGAALTIKHRHLFNLIT